HLSIGDLGDDGADDLTNVGELRDIALARIELGSDTEVSRFGETPAKISYMLMNAKDFLNYQNDGKSLAMVRHRSVSGNLAIGYRYFDFARDKAIGVGRDCLGRNRLDCQRKPRSQCSDNEFASCELGVNPGNVSLGLHGKPPCQEFKD